MVPMGIAAALAAYLLGSINFAVIFTKLFIKQDVRDFGSGNAGATNAMRIGGVVPGILTFVCDTLKGFVACYIGKMIFDYINTACHSWWSIPVYGGYICGVACILGHVFPIFFGFKGGKGVAVGAGAFLCICPLAVLTGIIVFALVMLVFRIVSLSSIIASTTVVLMSFLLYDKTGGFLLQLIFGLIIWFIIVIKHSDNIKRLIKGEEKKLSVRR